MAVKIFSPQIKHLKHSLWIALILTLSFSLFVPALSHSPSHAATAPPSPQQATPSAPVTFTNPEPIAINTGTSSPYPSSITVSGLTGNIPTVPGSFRVTINSLSHNNADDFGMVLVGPTGAAYAFQNGAGDSYTPLNNVTYTIADNGLIYLPYTAWGPGTYKPTNHYADDYFPPPGPGYNYESPGPDSLDPQSFASVFGGTNPNGVWNLYIRDWYANGSFGTISGGWSLTFDMNPPPFYPRKPVLDFDGDGKTDYSLTRDTGGSRSWYIEQSTAGFSAAAWGSTGDSNVPGDYDGDGKWDIAIWRAGTFYILRSLNGTVQTISHGQAGDDPRNTQDFDGDGRADPTVTTNDSGSLKWIIKRSIYGFITTTHFGNAATDVGLRGDFDGDGFPDLAVYRNSSGTPANTFIIRRSSDQTIQYTVFGDSSLDKIVPADFDSDSKTDCAVWRESTGTWYWLNSSNGAFHAFNFGVGNLDFPTPGDFDGDGKTDHAVWRPTDGTFYVNRSTNGFHAFQFGTNGDSPVGHFLQVR